MSGRIGADHTATRRVFLRTSAGALFGCAMAGAAAPDTAQGSAIAAKPPNFIVVFTDDQGYNDVGCFGSPTIKSPHLDRMASEGMRFTDFHAAAPVCTPSRAALLTGCYAQRVSMASIPWEDDREGGRPVVFADSTYGLHPDEITVAELLRQQGYATAAIGKWHLGHAPEFLPTRQGFDSFFGVPYGLGQDPPLLRNEEKIEYPIQFDTLTDRYHEEALRFITANQDRPFFLYLAHNMPHVPLHLSERFRGKSTGGLYGDVIECIDWGVGQILDTLDCLGLAENTLVIFTSDNGPWFRVGEAGGLATPLRGSKGTTYEGGMREPCIMRWPGTIPAGTVCSEFCTTMDFLPTFVALSGASMPDGRIIDGKNIVPLMKGSPGATTPYEVFYYYLLNELQAVRSGPWKLRFELPVKYENLDLEWPDPDALMPAALYNLDTDPGEQKNLIQFHPEIEQRLRALAEQARMDLGDTRTGTEGRHVRPIARAKIMENNAS